MPYDPRSNLSRCTAMELEVMLAELTDDFHEAETEEEQELLGRRAQEIDDELDRRRNEEN